MTTNQTEERAVTNVLSSGATTVIAKPRILVIDDDFGIRQGLAALFDTAGYEPVCAENGLHALSLLRDGLRPACILLDLMMPTMNGWEFMRELTTDPALAQLPVIVTTVVASHWGYPVPLDRVVTKPLDTDRLLKLIATSIDRVPNDPAAS